MDILETAIVDDLKKEGEQVYRIIIVSDKEKNGFALCRPDRKILYEQECISTGGILSGSGKIL